MGAVRDEVYSLVEALPANAALEDDLGQISSYIAQESIFYMVEFKTTCML